MPRPFLWPGVWKETTRFLAWPSKVSNSGALFCLMGFWPAEVLGPHLRAFLPPCQENFRRKRAGLDRRRKSKIARRSGGRNHTRLGSIRRARRPEAPKARRRVPEPAGRQVDLGRFVGERTPLILSRLWSTRRRSADAVHSESIRRSPPTLKERVRPQRVSEPSVWKPTSPAGVPGQGGDGVAESRRRPGSRTRRRPALCRGRRSAGRVRIPPRPLRLGHGGGRPAVFGGQGQIVEALNRFGNRSRPRRRNPIARPPPSCPRTEGSRRRTIRSGRAPRPTRTFTAWFHRRVGRSVSNPGAQGSTVLRRARRGTGAVPKISKDIQTCRAFIGRSLRVGFGLVGQVVRREGR